MPSLWLDSAVQFGTMLGQEIAKSDWFLVPQELIVAFAEVTGDRQWIHIDCQRAKRESAYGTTIAHGFLTLSLVSQMFSNAIQIRESGTTINYGLNRVRFPNAVAAGSRIRATFSVHAFKTIPNGFEITFSVVVEGQDTAKPCCVAEWILRYYP